MELKDVLYEVRSQASWITLNRPRWLNALSAEMLTNVRRAFEVAADDKGVRAVVMTGAGRGFCAGADIHVMDNASLESFRAFLLPFTGLCTLVRDFPKPTIAAINGVAVGGGFEMTLVCDFRIGSTFGQDWFARGQHQSADDQWFDLSLAASDRRGQSEISRHDRPHDGCRILGWLVSNFQNLSAARASKLKWSLLASARRGVGRIAHAISQSQPRPEIEIFTAFMKIGPS